MKKFFISSTFYDMHAERDMIQNIVQPAVNQKLNEQGEYVSFSDLRWGIDTISDTTKHRILDACFDEIDSCKPYFIVFIGGRYGWIPKELVAPYQNRFGNTEILNKSITELEVLYALKLNTNKLNRCLFYFKDDAVYEDEDGLKREEVIKHISDLRQKIEKIAPTQIRYYNSIVDSQTEKKLADQLVSDIYNIISSEKALSWQERIATLNEYKVAMNSLKKYGHPKILFLASKEPAKDETLSVIKKEIMDANQYWNTCNNLEHMQSIFRDCIEWDVTLLSKSKNRRV